MSDSGRSVLAALLTPGRVAAVGFGALSALVLASTLVLAVNEPPQASGTEPLRSGLLAATSLPDDTSVSRLDLRVLSALARDRLQLVEAPAERSSRSAPGRVRSPAPTPTPTAPTDEPDDEPGRLETVLGASMLVSSIDAAGNTTAPATSAEARPGDRLTYTITVVNLGRIRTSGSMITSHFPSGTTWIANDCSLTNAGDTESVCLRAGPGGDSGHSFVAVAGPLRPGEHVTVGFTVLVNPDTPDGTVITDHAHAYPTPTALGRPFDSNLTVVGIHLVLPRNGAGGFGSFMSSSVPWWRGPRRAAG